MSIKYICDVCKEEILTHPDEVGKLLITIEGNRWRHFPNENKIVHCKNTYHVHEKCISSFEEKLGFII